MLKTTFLSLLVFITLFAAFSANTRAKRAINPFLDSMGKRAVNPFMDSIGKRMNSFEPILYYQKRFRFFTCHTLIVWLVNRLGKGQFM
ncbi:hypothetical protein DICVIV_12376 [Dictyocaulus viviparus]|uniref:Uncharacterized protein n=1 Tax=Dictyocaulus viviparus TaxID=29172 RepID=A0A0D8XAL0_DICVI|nr:hypothetical protein DICVIV_12376 [Dictyocaulus viviparus]